MDLKILHGDLIDAPTSDVLRVREGWYLICENGFIKAVCPELPEEYRTCPVEEHGRAVVIPAFSDLHIHMSQYAQRGIGMDKLLADWLSDYTFPQEARFARGEYAAAMYERALQALLRHGSFHAVMFTTIHKDACDWLFERCRALGMQALIGKVNMDAASPDYLCEDTAVSLRETEAFVTEHMGEALVKPILTPRFAPTSTSALMAGLGKLAQKYALGVQTHLVESVWEAQQAKRCFPDCACDAEIYERYGLLGHGPAVFAHVIFPEERDLALLRKYSAFAVHCPEATTNVIAGIMPARRLLRREGISLAMGSDVGSGSSPALYRQIAWAVQLSKQRSFYYEGDDQTLAFSEAFHLATAAGGRIFDRVGLLEPGYRFNALVLDGLEDTEFPLGPAARLERFCYCGDDRNITARYLNGKALDFIC